MNQFTDLIITFCGKCSNLFKSIDVRNRILPNESENDFNGDLIVGESFHRAIWPGKYFTF